jgi:hypothetical protein
VAAPLVALAVVAALPVVVDAEPLPLVEMPLAVLVTAAAVLCTPALVAPVVAAPVVPAPVEPVVGPAPVEPTADVLTGPLVLSSAAGLEGSLHAMAKTP